MSLGSAQRPGSSRSRRSAASASHTELPGPTDTTENKLTACATTQNLLLFAQGNVILCLNHDTLTLERTFDKHVADIAWICVDTHQGRSKRLVVSYDVDNTAIIWDVHTGREVSRFSAYDPVLCATFDRNGHIFFGNHGGQLFDFDPLTQEHTSVRLIYDPLTAIALSTDGSKVACGFRNGSIIVGTLHPSFAIVHTLSFQDRPEAITGLHWHHPGKNTTSEMVASHTADGDLRVWSIPRDRTANTSIVRKISESRGVSIGPTWFSWSKSGHILQYADRELCLFDVRVKNVTSLRVPIIGHMSGVAVFPSRAALFIINSNFLVQQWDLNPDGEPFLVCEEQYLPPNAPPSPPGSRERSKRKDRLSPPALPTLTDSETSGDEYNELSIFGQGINALDAEEEQERRDGLGPLSPASSRSTSSSRSSKRKMAAYLYDRPNSRGSGGSRDDLTEFAMSPSLSRQRDSGSVETSASSRASRLRTEVIPSPETPPSAPTLDLFTFTKSRLNSLPSQILDNQNRERTPDALHKAMLKTVFDLEGDPRGLIRDELSRHPADTSRAVILLKWLDELRPETSVSMIGSRSLTDSDWTLFAFNSIAIDEQKKSSHAIVQRMIAKGDIHQAVAILTGIGQHDRAIDIYVSHTCYMEALLLVCLYAPTDWDRQAFLLRRWAEASIANGQSMLGIKILNCLTEETTRSWPLPPTETKSKDRALISPQSPGHNTRLTAKNASLRLITSFDQNNTFTSPLDGLVSNEATAVEVTPIAQSALSPDGNDISLRRTQRDRDPSSALSTRTATPGSYNKRRQHSRAGSSHTRTSRTTPQTAHQDTAPPLQRVGTPSQVHQGSCSTGIDDAPRGNEIEARGLDDQAPPHESENVQQLPSLNVEALGRLTQGHHRTGSRDKRPDGLHLDVINSAFLDSALSPALPTQSTGKSGYSFVSSRTGMSAASSPPLTAGSGKSRALEQYLDTIEQARVARNHQRSSSRQDGASGARRGSGSAHPTSRDRLERPASSGRHSVDRVQRPRPSPTSPVAMSPEEVLAATQARTASRESPAQLGSPMEPKPTSRSRSRRPSLGDGSRPAVRTSEAGSPIMDRGRRDGRSPSVHRSESSASPPPMGRLMTERDHNGQTKTPVRRNAHRLHSRQQSQTRSPGALREASQEDYFNMPGGYSAESPPYHQTAPPVRKYTPLSKELAAKELEERRLSLARRPSAPAIPLPGQSPLSQRPQMAPRSPTIGSGVLPIMHPGTRSQSVDLQGRPVQSFHSVPVGLPANPSAMLHARSMSFSSSRENSKLLPPPPPPLSADHDGGYVSGDMLSPLLPSTTYQPAPLNRSTSVPLEHVDGHALRSQGSKTVPPPPVWPESFGHGVNYAQQPSPPIVTASIDETIHESDIAVEEIDEPPLLPELQHLSQPPPPPLPPLPSSLSAGNSPLQPRRGSYGFPLERGEISISLDRQAVSDDASPIENRAATASPRRGRPSITEVKSRLRNMVRSTSRKDTEKSPQQGTNVSPYETVLPFPLPQGRKDSFGDSARTKSPQQGYVRNPKEIRANMPPDLLQGLAYIPSGKKHGGGEQGGMI